MSDRSLSVVIPAHNAAAFLTEALDSVFAQGTEEVEVVVVEDRSTDGTGDVARERGTADDRIRTIDTPDLR